MVDKKKELDATTLETVKELREMTVDEIKELQREWLLKIECDNVSPRVYQYIDSVVGFVIREKQQVA